MTDEACRTRGEFAKRVFDVAFSSVVLLTFSPVLLVIAVAVKLTLDGPVLYRAPRSGRFGIPFTVWKFRTMVQNADRVGGPSTGLHDPRVTRVGSFLRRYKLDELPQFVNVLRGDMSVVGPRPEVPRYTAEYDEHERVILNVRPGITDPASLRFIELDRELGSDQPDHVYEERVRPVKNALRVRYVQERTLAGDFLILWRTCVAMLRLMLGRPVDWTEE